MRTPLPMPIVWAEELAVRDHSCCRGLPLLLELEVNLSLAPVYSRKFSPGPRRSRKELQYLFRYPRDLTQGLFPELPSVAELEFGILSQSPRVLGLQLCTTTPSLSQKYF